MEYPKINSLWKREGWYFDEQCKKDPTKQAGRQSFIIGDYASEEFGNIKYWDVEEKIDGTNIRVFYKDGQVRFGGRTKDAHIPCHLLDYLQGTLTPGLLGSRFADKDGSGTGVILFGEGFGPKIQAGGYYSDKPGFCLFDVKIGHWWLEKDTVRGLATLLGVHTPPTVMLHSTEEEILQYVREKKCSLFAMNDPKHEHVMEGVICRPIKQMLFRNGDPIMFKLKCKEF